MLAVTMWGLGVWFCQGSESLKTLIGVDDADEGVLSEPDGFETRMSRRDEWHEFGWKWRDNVREIRSVRVIRDSKSLRVLYFARK